MLFFFGGGEFSAKMHMNPLLRRQRVLSVTAVTELAVSVAPGAPCCAKAAVVFKRGGGEEAHRALPREASVEASGYRR